MKKMNNKSGFTLKEIIVVLIIIGILAAIALPNLFTNVAKSRSAEALTITQSFRTQFEACVQAYLTTGCKPTFATNGGGASSTTQSIADPGNADLTFSMPVLTPSPLTGITYSIKAISNQDSAQSITMVRATDGTISCSGTGVWLGAC